jgi:hypothetical protein
MQKVAEAVSGLDADAVARVVRWMADAYNVTVGAASESRGGVATNPVEVNGNGANGIPEFTELAELYSAVSPESEADKALVVGYWTQFREGKAEFGAQEINTVLKNLGHSVKNITTAFDTLKARKPAPVMQLKKAGTTKQARKTYKLTLAGKSAVEAMIGQH